MKSNRKLFAIPWGLTSLALLIVPKVGGSERIYYAFYWSDRPLESQWKSSGLIRSVRGVEWAQLGITLALIWVIFLGYYFIFAKKEK